MQSDQEPHYVVATYEEIRVRFGLGGTDQARIKAKRRKWAAEPRNHPGAIARIRVPQKEWDAAPQDREQGSRGAIPNNPDHSRSVKPLEDAVTIIREEERLRAAAEAKTLREEWEKARSRADRAEGELDGMKLGMEHLNDQLTRAVSMAAEAQRQAAEAKATADSAMRAKEEAEAALERIRRRGLFSRLWNRL